MSEYAAYARDLTTVADGLDEDAEDAVMRVARDALRTAQNMAPVDTGRLRNELHLVRKGSVVAVESTVDYAVFQEFGTSNMAPNPFIGPAFARGAVDLVREVEAIADDVEAAL